MFNLKAKALRAVSRYKLYPANYSSSMEGMTLHALSAGKEAGYNPAIGLIGLKPLTLAFSFSFENAAAIEELIIKKNGKELSRMALTPSTLQLQGYVAYEIKSSVNFLQTGFQKIKGFLGICLKNQLQPNKNFTMTPRSIQQLFDFCIYPRPVYLLSGIKPGEKRAFPLDVIGIYPGNKILFSIRKSNASNAHIQSRKTLLLARAPYASLSEVYSLGKNNFSTNGPAAQGYTALGELYYPSFVTDIMEISVDSFCVVGEHYCYSGQIKNRILLEQKEQLAHVPWFALSLFK